MKKTVTLNLKSEIFPEGAAIDISAELWERFEKRAKEVGVSPEELAVIALEHFLMTAGH